MVAVELAVVLLRPVLYHYYQGARLCWKWLVSS